MSSNTAQSKHLSARAFNSAVSETIQTFMSEFQIPGAAVAIVRNNEPDFICGYGAREVGQPEAVDTHTQFAIASNSKAFLASCLAILVDKEQIAWDDPVIKHLPEFEMHDQTVTRMMTVRDLLVHRSGLPLGAGDLMLMQRGQFSEEDVLRSLPHFEPSALFRDGYAYDNCLYIVAGILLKRVSGQSWDEFVTTQIFKPLGMLEAAPNPSFVSATNRVARHARMGPPVIGIGPLQVVTPNETDLNGPAGGIHASASEIASWLRVQLARGRLPSGDRLWSDAQTEEMWRPKTIITSGQGPDTSNPQRAVIEAYALGWGVNDYRGHRSLNHSGGLVGQITRTALLPDQGAGLAIYTNSAESEAVSALRYAILDLLLGVESFDWIAYAKKAVGERESRVRTSNNLANEASQATPTLGLKYYSGRYRDPWCGDVIVECISESLHLRFERIPTFTSVLVPMGENAFRTQFAIGVAEDAIVSFSVMGGNITGLRMSALSPIADFSYDFHHLKFEPVTA